MKYYKYIKDEGTFDEKSQLPKLGEIFQENFTPLNWLWRIKDSVNYNSLLWQEVTEEEYLIQEAKKRYPIGSIVIDIRNNEEDIFIDTHDQFHFNSITNILYFNKSLRLYCTDPYNNIGVPSDVWAEIKTQNTMEKKIKGYKLIKSEYLVPARRILNCLPDNDHHPLSMINHEDDIDKLKNAGVLDLWFEPVYTPTYKVGDWVYIEGTYGSLDLPLKTEGDIVQIEEIDNSYVSYVRHGKKCSGSSLSGIKRLATEAEYKKYLEPKVIIKGYTAKIGETSVTFGCQTYSKEFIIELANCLDNNGFNFMGSNTNYKEEILKLRNYYESR
jgi:hypothetical protein